MLFVVNLVKSGPLISDIFTHTVSCVFLLFFSGLVSWIHWWLNFMSSWVILQTRKASILKTFPVVRIPTVSSSWLNVINKASVKISKCFLYFLAFLNCNKTESDASCKFVCFFHIAGKMAASDSNDPDEKMNEVCLQSLFLRFISTVYYNTVSYPAA